MTAQPADRPTRAPGYENGGPVPAYEDAAEGEYVYLCRRCGQPLAGPHDLCNSALHVGTDGLGLGRAVRSTELARLARAARAALGGP
jgi:hypothetical protein